MSLNGAVASGAALRIGRARLRNARPGDRALLASGLDRVSQAAVGVPERALLIVPRLIARRALPRRGDPAAFAAEVAGDLQAALRRARRPGEPRSADDSLLFADELDAAVFLIEQWTRGAPPAERSWWPHVTGGAAPQDWWRRTILRDGRRLPTLLARLSRRGDAEPWLRRLAVEEVRLGLAAVARAHGLTLPQPGDIATPTTDRRISAPAERPSPMRDPADELRHVAALVEAVVPEIRRSDLPPTARLLLLVALLADRRPAIVSSRSASLAFAAVAAGELAVSAATAKPLSSPAAVPTAAMTATREPSRMEARRGRGVRIGPQDIAPAAERLPTPARRRQAREPRTGTAEPAERRVDRTGLGESALAIASQYGGLLFLLNALIGLGIYGDFTAPRLALPGLSPSGLLRLLGRAWFGAAFGADPLHGLLIRLAGRGADAARDFEQRHWSVPEAWLLPWGHSSPAVLERKGRRSVLWHPAGFPLADLDPLDLPPESGVARHSPRPSGHPALPAAPRARWISCLRLYLEARVARALGCDGGREAVTLLCRQPASISTDGERVEARFALAEHPLAIRLAGLDRDPGWIPAARLDFRFVFE